MSASEKSFRPGDSVVLSQLKRRGTVAEGPNHRGEYLIACGALSLWVSPAALERVDPGKESKRAAAKEATIRRPRETIRGGGATITIDLHGLSREDAVRKLEDALDRALRSEGARGESISLEVVHGIGSGAVRRAVHEYLAKSKVVASYRDDVANPGVTWVYL